MASSPETRLTDTQIRRLAGAIREACVSEMTDAYEMGGLSGLCAEGRWELALDRFKSFDLESVIRSTLAERE